MEKTMTSIAPADRAASARTTEAPWFMVVARSALFLAFQALIALVYALLGNPNPWAASIAWWPLSIFLTGVVNLALLARLLRAEGSSYREMVRFRRGAVAKDMLWLLGLMVVSAPFAMLPSQYLATALFGSVDAASALYIKALPVAAAAALMFLMPLAQGLTELPNYFGYCRPRIEQGSGSAALAIAVTVGMLAAQHIFAPFIPDARFLLFRGLSFLPFALVLGIGLRLRPQLLPYMMVVHFLMDVGTGWFILAAAM
jgi:hypothetical protein